MTGGAEETLSSAAQDDEPDPAGILKLGLGFWASKTLLSATELNLFTVLARGGLTADDLTNAIGINRRGAHDFFDALVSLDMLDRDDGVYRNTPSTDLYLDKEKPSYIGGLLEMSNRRLYSFWGALTDGLRSGRPQNEVRDGEQNFDRLYGDPEQLREFLNAMTGMSWAAGGALAKAFAWRDYGWVVDIGCAEGGTLVQIAHAHPHLRGTGFDLPPVQPVFSDYIEANALADRIDFIGGDFFTDDLPHADVLIMGHIIQHWNLDEKRYLLARAYDALPSGGALIVYDWMIDEARRKDAYGLLMSLNMLIETEGGFDYTGEDCRAWMKEAGFHRAGWAPLAAFDSMVVGYK